MADTIFSLESPAYLSQVLPRVQGIRRVPRAKLFFPEEYPDLIAEEARILWGVSGRPGQSKYTDRSVPAVLSD